ncbi:unnamed protein product [Prunus armeniaca]|uniref:Uncharacterized protein n=1 Tax=Prunus armeniaca TaxID=36596 RepID=A0A6J5TSD4_PRUAR|nr:unnamed protein product [Prunus armeniaca]
MASSSPSQADLQLQLQPETESQMSSIVYEIEKCKEQSLEKKRGLEEAKEQVEKAAYAVLEMLNNRA